MLSTRGKSSVCYKKEELGNPIGESFRLNCQLDVLLYSSQLILIKPVE